MNLNPDEGHIMDYLTEWGKGYDIGTPSEASTKDYLSSKIWDMPVSSIAIVHHQNVSKKENVLI